MAVHTAVAVLAELNMSYEEYWQRQRIILENLAPYLSKVKAFLHKSNGFPQERLAFGLDGKIYVPGAWLNGSKEYESLDEKTNLAGKPDIKSILELNLDNKITLAEFEKIRHVIYFSINGATEYVINSYFSGKIKDNTDVSTRQILDHAFHANSSLKLNENCDCVCSLLKTILSK